MPDMLVKLYTLPDISQQKAQIEKSGIIFKRALAMDKGLILPFIRRSFPKAQSSWASECEVALLRQPTACYIAVAQKEIVGFACYDTSAKGFFGPLGVSDMHTKQGIGKVLLILCLQAMEMEGYGYGIIPWVSSVDYYQKVLGAEVIKGSEPGIYHRRIKN
ncbi:MAG: hypothetical protein ACJA13_002701 [Paraglaciecola sp.]|jgi:hypothetical protein